jgi:hypothetical protein
MARIAFHIIPVFASALLLGACASDGGLFQTSSVTPVSDPVISAKPRVDPACVALSNQIEGLRKEGTIERLEKVAAGKGDNVQVKRTAIAKQTELNRANADFQIKCGPRIPASTQAAAPSVPAVTVASAATASTAAPAAGKAAAKAALAAAPAKASGVTVAPSAVPKTQ